MMIERIVAAITLVVCLAMLLRLLAGQRRRDRLDRFLRRVFQLASRYAYRVRHFRAARREAARAAEEAIRRARGQGEWTGNVYTPKSMRKPPRDTLH